MIRIIDAIMAINSTAEVVVRGTDIDTCEIEWLNGTAEISKADIKTKMDELQADYDAKEYQRKRKAEYPAIEDQLDDIYHNGIDAWKANIKIIKDKYPKE